MKKLVAMILLMLLSFSGGCTFGEEEKAGTKLDQGKENQSRPAVVVADGSPAKALQDYAYSIAKKDFKAAHDLLSVNSAKNVTAEQMKKGFTYDISLERVLNEQTEGNVALVAVCFLVNDTIAGKRYVLDYIPVVKEQEHWAIVTELAEKEQYQQPLDKMQQVQEKLMYQDSELIKFRKWMDEQNRIFAKPLVSEKNLKQ